MAFKMQTVFGAETVLGSGTGTSGPVDLRENLRDAMALSVSLAVGTSGTWGETVFSYVGCAKEDGTYVSPASAVAIGTFGTALQSDIIEFTPELMPFMKIVATQSDEDAVVSADLFMR